MLYRPNFCCECGEKIERTEWRSWTSRRFCPVCETEYKVFDLLPKAIAGLAAIAAIIGFGGYLQSRPATAFPAVKQQFAETRNAQPNAGSPTNKATETSVIQSQTSLPAAAPVQTHQADQGTVKNLASADDEALYYCGAATKKGTPCSRRVKGNVRCWQHKGMPAVVPAEQLKVR
jgi:hypothetical protein